MLMAWHQIVGNKNINGLIAEGYRSINTDQIFQFFCLKARFLLQVLSFYILLMLLYLYFMTANLSTAPPFLYSQF